MLDCRYYYHIINKSTNKSLHFSSSQSTKNKSYISQSNIDDSVLNQLWLIKQTSISNVYTIVHAQSCMSLQKTQNNQLQLYHHGKDHKNQYFYITNNNFSRQMDNIKRQKDNINNIQLDNFNKNEYIISQYMCPNKYLVIQDNKIITKPISKQSISISKIWIIQRVTSNPQLLNSSILHCNYSGYILQTSLKPDQLSKPIYQGQYQGYLSQRWIIKKQKQFYTITNLRSKLLLTINSKVLKQNINVIQKTQNTNFQHQLWSLEERGYRQYSIRCAYSEELYIGSKNHDLKDGVEIVLVKDQFKNIWKIIGPFLI